MTNVIVTGAPGQDASYLCEYLLDLGYNVHGVSRRSTRDSVNMNDIYQGLHQNYFHEHILDINDYSGVCSLVKSVQPIMFFNLAAMSHVGQSFKEPITTAQTDGLAVAGILESIATNCPSCKFYQAGTSEMFGNNGEHYAIIDDEGDIVPGKIQNESTPFYARSPYGAAKIYAYHMVKLYRESYNLNACCGILFNHESPRRSKDFVTRKITSSIASILAGKQSTIKLGNLSTFRDFGHAKDYVKAMYLMLQSNNNTDYVIATGKTISILRVLQFACDLVGLKWTEVYETDPSLYRPAEVKFLCGNSEKARNELNWAPLYTWEDIIKEMLIKDLELEGLDLARYQLTMAKV